MSAEKKRLKANTKRTEYWKHWGPYLSERQWGTVREDYSTDGETWKFFSYEMARSRAYRWGEDGIAGISDTRQRLCFAWTFWNEKDPWIKERLFGLSNPEGNHGEDVKELYYYLDNTPTHSYMKYLYKYPQAEFPYEEIRKVNASRSQKDPEYELIDTGIFDHNRYFDIFVEYAKKSPEDICIRITVHNRGNEEKSLHLMPTFWARNLWFKEGVEKPIFRGCHNRIEVEHQELGKWILYGDDPDALLFTENESKGKEKYAKDGINEYLVEQKQEAVNPENEGSKAAFHYLLQIPAGEERELVMRLTTDSELKSPLGDISKVFKTRKKEADEFYDELFPKSMDEDRNMIARQALSGMLWNKMYYNLIISDWLKGDPHFYPPLLPHNPLTARNKEWLHLHCDDIISAADKWEFNMFFSWDTAFHAIPLAMVDPDYAKHHLHLLTQEWYMHPNGMLPACEWNFHDVNPPVHAWAAWRVFKIEQKRMGETDRFFLERIFQKLLLNFTWWVNRKDSLGKNIFQGGFLGLDNISVFNRSEDLPIGATLYQSDATSWMGMFCLNMLTISFELAKENSAYEDLSNKFYHHFLLIVEAINFNRDYSSPLWDEEDGFYYDILKMPDGSETPLKVRSLVGLMPLLAVTTIEPEVLERCTLFKKKMDWFLDHRKDLCQKAACMRTLGQNNRRILALVDKEKLVKLLKVMLDEEEFLSPYGIRSLSKYHAAHPFSLKIDGKSYSVGYEPAESQSRLFGGNSNWRGPIWFPINILLIESLQKFHHYYGETLKVECPTGSGQMRTLEEVAEEISKRLVKVFEKDEKGSRPVFGNRSKFQSDPHFRDHILFYEYFHGSSGQGLGASHQTGWTGCVAKLIKQLNDCVDS